MKKIKYTLIPALVLILCASCTKHVITYDAHTLGNQTAEFQLHYMEPIDNISANYIDSVFVDDVLYSSVDGAGQLLPYNGVPGGGVGRFFAVEPGTRNLKFYRAGQLVYNQDVTLQEGKWNVVVYKLDKAPIVIDNLYPYWTDKSSQGTSETWGTDSVFKVRLFNFLFEDPDTPYPGRLQYQCRRQDLTNVDSNWVNVGEPISFGEATERFEYVVHKTIENSSGYQTVYYRIKDADADTVLYCMNSNGKMVELDDYWIGYIGRVVNHFLYGNRTTSPTCAFAQWTSL